MAPVHVFLVVACPAVVIGDVIGPVTCVDVGMAGEFGDVHVVGGVAGDTIITATPPQIVRVEIFWCCTCRNMACPASAIFIAHVPVVCAACDLDSITPCHPYNWVYLFMTEQTVSSVWHRIYGLGSVIW